MHFNKEVFFDQFRPWYKKKTGKRTLSVQTANGVDFLLDGFSSNSMWKDVRHIAYALATIAHETAWTFLPIKEYRAKAGTKGRANQDRYWLSGYYGRGYVQLTWLRNYQLAAKKLGVELVKNPALALRNDIAFKILTYGMHEGWFTGKKLSDFINVKEKDYKNSRKIINGLDKASTIAAYAQEFENMLRDAIVIEAVPPKLVDNTVDSKPTNSNTDYVTDGEAPQEFDDEGNPIDGIQQGQQPAQDVAEGDVKPGEAAPEEPAKAGEAVVGGRPDDPPVIVETPQEESISGWRTWPTTVTATLSGLGISAGSAFTWVSGIELSPQAQVMVGWAIILGLLVAAAYGLFYLYSRMRGTEDEKRRKHEIHMKELELASRPDRYNVKTVG